MQKSSPLRNQQLPLGEILLQAEAVNRPQLNQTLAIARNTKTRIGDIFISEGIIGYPLLYQALAAQKNLDYVNLLEYLPESLPEISLLDEQLLEEYIHYKSIPYRRNSVGWIIATSEYSQETISWAKERYGENISFVITSPRDIHQAIQIIFAKSLSHKSAYRLYEISPELSACKTPKAASKLRNSILITSSLLSILACFIFPTAALMIILALCHIIYSITNCFKIAIYATGRIKPYRAEDIVRKSTNNSLQNKNIATVDKKDKYKNHQQADHELPIYTILVPMYKEAESIAGMLRAISAINYPSGKLDVKLIMEEDDLETLEAAYLLRPRYNFEIIRVPSGGPRTKPKACNYALRFARGEYVTVYDADDIPEKEQLRKAVQLFRTLPPEVICLQARLNYYNTHDNLLTRLFSLEYFMLFEMMLPGMSRLDMPVMLGGTSNHFSLAKLRELGEWDPFNVTEDADLGTRLAAQGFYSCMFDSITIEEAPNSISAWLYQRARWIKGYMQTWLVHMRRPFKLYKALGWHGFSGFQCFVALSSFAYLTAPLAWLLSISSWIINITSFPEWLIFLAQINLLFHLLIHSAIAIHAASLYQQQRTKMIMSAFIYPFYLILHSVASYIALWQLFLKPYVWNKTKHGKARTFSNFHSFNII